MFCIDKPGALDTDIGPAENMGVVTAIQCFEDLEDTPPAAI